MFCYCAESRRAARLLTARYDAALSAAGLTSAQFELMSLLAAAGSMHGRAIAERLAVDPATLSRGLKVLSAAKWVRARREQQDGRQLAYSLTPAGHKRLALALPLWQKAHRETRKHLDSGNDSLRQTLQQMTAMLRA